MQRFLGWKEKRQISQGSEWKNKVHFFAQYMIESRNQDMMFSVLGSFFNVRKNICLCNKVLTMLHF